MQTVIATEAKQGLAALLDASAREPVLIQRQMLDAAVVISEQKYERLTRLNAAELLRFCHAVGQRAEHRAKRRTVGGAAGQCVSLTAGWWTSTCW